MKQLAAKHNRSIDWIRKELRAYESPPLTTNPRKVIAVMDCVFFGRKRGYMVVRDPHRKVNIYWSEITRESVQEYKCARDTLEFLGYEIEAVVVDGKRGLKRLFSDMPVQMCLFHQAAAIRRYLTLRPRLEAGQELKALAYMLGDMCERCFASELARWYEKWRMFLAEKTVNIKTGKSHYTHRRLRSAYFSLKRNLPLLYTYKRYPDLGIPTTTNGLESSFGYLKELVRVHRGLNHDLKRKMIDSILQNRHTKT